MLNEAGSNLLPNWLVSHSGVSPGLLETCKTSKTGRGAFVPWEQEETSCSHFTDLYLSLASSSRVSFAEVFSPTNKERPWGMGRRPLPIQSSTPRSGPDPALPLRSFGQCNRWVPVCGTHGIGAEGGARTKEGQSQCPVGG